MKKKSSRKLQTFPAMENFNSNKIKQVLRGAGEGEGGGSPGTPLIRQTTERMEAEHRLNQHERHEKKNKFEIN